MTVTGPHKDKNKARTGQASVWYLSFFAPKQHADGTLVLNAKGSPVVVRHRTYYKTRAEADADRPRLETQHAAAGVGAFLFDRKAADDYEAARKEVGDGISLLEVARFWRQHHPLAEKQRLGALVTDFLTAISTNLEKGRHWSDLKWRLKAFCAAGFGERYPDTVTRPEIFDYLRTAKNKDGTPPQPRSRRNHKTALCTFFGWLLSKDIIAANPAGDIKRRMLPREIPKEIEYLSIDYVRHYLRCAQRYAPELVAHEVVQLISGVRSDDEMANFRAEYVLPRTKEIIIPASIAKTEKREVIQGLEENFWTWWAAYAPKQGLLRPPNYGPRWNRLRVLASITDPDEADRLARLPIKTLLARPNTQAILETWPWNGRRRTFCTYHIAKHQSAEKTALILRHRGSSYTLHESYRGLGATQEDGEAYFAIMPEPAGEIITPVVEPKGIVRIQAERRAAMR
jgi:hypothetical protein